MSAVKYSNEYAFVAYYMVDEPYRGGGYGLAMTKTVLGSLPKGCNFGANTLEENATKYVDFLGLKSYWSIHRMAFLAHQATLSLSDMSHPTGITIKPACELPFHNMLDYDTSVHVYACLTFLKKWISAPNCFSYAAINNNGTVVGYTVVRTTLRQKDGWIIGPLFADNSQIARCVYQAVFDKVSKEDPLGIDVPNGNALHVAKELPSKEIRRFVRLYNKGVPPKFPLWKVFGSTSSHIE